MTNPQVMTTKRAKNYKNLKPVVFTEIRLIKEKKRYNSKQPK